ncbi:allatostatin-A receptor-like [Actinia tenebrosa]|uniref:Allatostatin-A receptor-like n=1 Tax=Actinia tenebrosa TaxID=6105 RepID=A0A6P8J5K8_ACTTE|nr:allatostatin-A receptor-like [Actinia tenebrosa]
MIGNTLVILIILTNKSMKSPMNYLLVNLAVADMIVGIFLVPRSILQYFIALPDGSKGQIFCEVLSIGNMTWVGGAASVFSLAAICFERYFAVMHPYSARLRLNCKKVGRIVVTSWLFASALNAPMFGQRSNHDQEKKRCIEEWPRELSWLQKAFSFLWFTAAGFAPLAIMFVFYSRVIYSLWFKKNQVQGTQLAVLKSRKRVTKMVVIVSVVFLVCWIPTLLLYATLHDNVAFPISGMSATGSIMVLFNSAINPFIYSFQSENFRRCLKDIVSCRKPRNNRIAPPN